jgi:hypothetical protein
MKFILNLWPPAVHLFEEITTEFSQQFKILNVSDYRFKDKSVFEYVVREIYKIDGAREAGVNIKVDRFTNLHYKKAERFNHYNNDDYTIRCIQFDIPTPNFRPRGSDGKPIATQTEELKKHYRGKYKSRIENYVHDIIIHIGDNEVQTKQLTELLNRHDDYRLERDGLDLKFFLNVMSQYKYFITKIDVPYVPKDFPTNYAIGKDLDIVVSKEHFEDVKLFCDLYSRTYPSFNIIWEKAHGGFGLRFEKDGKLHFKFDVRHLVEHISDGHIVNSMNNRLLKDGYFILDNVHEKPFREVAYNFKTRPKPWHKEWLDKNG